MNSSMVQTTSLFILQFIYCIWLGTHCLIGMLRGERGLMEAERAGWFVCHYFTGPIPAASARSHHDEPLHGRIQVTGLTKLGRHEEQEESAQHALGKHKGQRELNWSTERGEKTSAKWAAMLLSVGEEAKETRLLGWMPLNSPAGFFSTDVFFLPQTAFMGLPVLKASPGEYKSQ